ncbi:IclR family transcriptional regulator [Haladaptatus sp. R4]|uniref:IclR family transcriptional regulator n=1 Tax=Haladaptatus sp. R4 TaxID=1679489 RepID=UPI0007B49509|nr:IclR family transcriptional regulator [Haladaptatus sp. R4]KZN23197.1 IclR family transcriptional regulator [Haladaptatus sp. R4]
MGIESSTKIKSTATAFGIVEYLKELEGATLSEVVDHFEMPTSTVHDHLQTLTELGYVLNDDGTYRIGTKFLELGGYARINSRIFQVSESELQNLAVETGEHANLMVEENGMGVFLMKQKGSEAIKIDTYEGMRVYLHTTAMGKAILAFMDDSRREDVLAQHGLPRVTEHSIGNRDVLEDELDAIRERGYATDDEERLNGIRCIAAPVMTDSGRVAGAVSISAPKNRMQGTVYEETFPKKILGTANIIEVNMRHM